MNTNEYPQNIICLKNGEIMDNLSEKIINVPAILLDKETGTLHGWGESVDVSVRLEKLRAAYESEGIPSMANGLVAVDFSGTGLNQEQKCYILKKCVEHSASGFPKNVYEHAIDGTLSDWLTKMMDERPLDLTAMD